MEEVPRITPENPIRNRKYNSQFTSFAGMRITNGYYLLNRRSPVKLLFYSILFTTETQTSKKEI